MGEKLKEFYAWMEFLERVKEVVFHAELKRAFQEICARVGKFEIHFFMLGELKGDKLCYFSELLIPPQINWNDESQPLMLPAPPGYYAMGHVHEKGYPKFSGMDDVYCSHYGIAVQILLVEGEISDICKFPEGIDVEPSISVRFEDNVPFITKEE
ncbi:MAG: hypothetical protein Q9M37_03690, partial [Desulfonauticus sp.]|nr:hypothetical protein [Desulfonauticus sp.]